MRAFVVSVFLWLVVCVLCLWLIPKAFSCPIRTVYQTPPYVAAYYPPKVVVAEVLVPVFVPTFTVSYNPALVPAAVAPAAAVAQGSAVPGTPSELQQLLGEMRRINQRLDSLERGERNPPLPLKKLAPKSEEPMSPDEPEPGISALTPASIKAKSCAACHTAGKLEEGIPFALVDAKGGELPLTPAQELKVGRYTYRGKCPPKGNKFNIKPLTDQEQAVLSMGKDGLK